MPEDILPTNEPAADVTPAPDVTPDEGVTPDVTPTENKAWYENLGVEIPDDNRGLFDKYKTAEDFVKGYSELNKAFSQKKGIQPLSEESTAEQIKEYREAMGIPEEPDAYSWEKPEDFNLDDERFTDWKKTMHEANLTDAQAKVLFEKWHEDDKQFSEFVQAEQEKLATESKAALKQDWGKDFDNRIVAAAEVAKKFNLVDSLKKGGIINDQNIIRLLDAVAQNMKEGRIPDAQNNAAAINEEYEKVATDPDRLDPSKPRYSELNKRFRELVEQRTRSK